MWNSTRAGVGPDTSAVHFTPPVSVAPLGGSTIETLRHWFDVRDGYDDGLGSQPALVVGRHGLS